jgi:phosphate transport system protein
VTHLEQNLLRDIELIRQKVEEMGLRCEKALKSGLQALLNKDRQLAYTIILRDRAIDELETELDRLCLEFIIRHQPVATHLRFVYATIKLIKELERIGDYAESIARQVLHLCAHQFEYPQDKYVELAHLSIPMLHDALQAFSNHNAELAQFAMSIEAKADYVRNNINADLLRLRQSGALPMEAFTPLMTIARRYERVADQAKNICEEVLYMTTGEYVKHKAPEVLRVLFVDLDNACLSQMAETIANSLKASHLKFTSAGLTAGKLDPLTIEFLKSKGLDLSAAVTKSVDQVADFDQIQVIIAFCPEARRVFPTPPTKTVGLEWLLVDPAQVPGSLDDKRAIFDNAFNFIHTHIQDLVKAMLGED